MFLERFTVWTGNYDINPQRRLCCCSDSSVWSLTKHTYTSHADN